jgi:hypothetical protein
MTIYRIPAVLFCLVAGATSGWAQNRGASISEWVGNKWEWVGNKWDSTAPTSSIEGVVGTITGTVASCPDAYTLVVVGGVMSADGSSLKCAPIDRLIDPTWN